MPELACVLAALDRPGAIDLGAGENAGAAIPWWAFGACAVVLALAAAWLSSRPTLRARVRGLCSQWANTLRARLMRRGSTRDATVQEESARAGSAWVGHAGRAPSEATPDDSAPDATAPEESEREGVMRAGSAQEAGLLRAFEATARGRGLNRGQRAALAELARTAGAPPVALLLSEHAFDGAAQQSEDAGRARAELLALRARLFHG